MELDLGLEKLVLQLLGVDLILIALHILVLQQC